MTEEKLSKSDKKRAQNDALRERALDIGLELIKEGGMENIKARVLAVRLGVSVGTIYNLFGQMDEFYLHLNATLYDKLFEAVSSALYKSQKKGQNTEEQMLALAKRYLKFVEDHADHWSAVLAFNRNAQGIAPVWYREKELALLGVIEDAIRDEPGIKSDIQLEIASRALWSAVHGVVTISISRGGLNQKEKDIWLQIELVVRAMAAELQKS